MWFLDTKSGCLQKAIDHRFEARPYAILSHVWSNDEQDFQEVLGIQRAAELASGATGTLSILPRLSHKTQGFCNYARKDHYEIAWMDTCCINKSSSAELSEAINSMYEWYRLASVCYVYLADVDREDPFQSDSQFSRARWHTRMWTLQELLAPSRVVFLSKDWEPLGTKISLASVIEAATGIPHDVLLDRTPLGSCSVAQRMSWASRRTATRMEDEAYALMGLFGVTMTTIYGEGRNAFKRLQEEILKQIPDQSVFLWGPILSALELPNFLPTRLTHHDSLQKLRREYGLLASRPADFENAGKVRSHLHASFAERLTAGRSGTTHPEYTITSYGIRVSLPVYAAHSFDNRSIRIALLSCSFDDNDCIGLLLEPDEGHPHGGYLVGAIALDEEGLHSACRLPGGSIIHRAIRIGHETISRLGEPIHTELHIFSPRGRNATTPHLTLPREPNWSDPASYTYQVIFPTWRCEQLVDEGFTVLPCVVADKECIVPSFTFVLRPKAHDHNGISVKVRMGPCYCVRWPSPLDTWRPPPMRADVWAEFAGNEGRPTRIPSPHTPCTHPDMPPATPDGSTHNSPGDAAPCISGSNQRPRQQTWPPVWHADDDYKHVNTRSWERRQGCDRGSEAISRHFDVHDPDGELVAQVLLTLDHAPDITSTCPNPWSQIYTLDLELPFFEISAAAKDEPRPKGDEIQTSPAGTSATVWGYDVKRGGFHVV
ncbi:hypothetical protein GY45DRAFT_240451 [Cubamyces sp. BRFM 1775]|nr:hypothetical protein GY45DRAFT_240451 [Cubamyces sp. BRFM 1775]